MFCGNCGEKIADGEKFCRKCGAAQGHPGGKNPQNSSGLNIIFESKAAGKKVFRLYRNHAIAWGITAILSFGLRYMGIDEDEMFNLCIVVAIIGIVLCVFVGMGAFAKKDSFIVLYTNHLEGIPVSNLPSSNLQKISCAYEDIQSMEFQRDKLVSNVRGLAGRLQKNNLGYVVIQDSRGIYKFLCEEQDRIPERIKKQRGY